MNANKIESRLEEFRSAVETSRESLGTIGGNSTGGPVPNTREPREQLMNALTAAAITNSIRFRAGGESVTLDMILEIEHQTWVRGKTEGTVRCVNLLDYESVELV